MNRRHHSPEEKVKILREDLENQVPLSDLAERYGIHLSDLYNWKKKLFEGAVELFSTKRNGKASADGREKEELKKGYNSVRINYRNLNLIVSRTCMQRKFFYS